MTKSCSVVLAVGVLSGKNSGSTQTLSRALIQSGLLADCPVIPGLINPSNLLELKANLPNYCASWTSSVLSILAVQSGVKPQLVSDIVSKNALATAKKMAITSETISVEDLLLDLRDNVKVISFS